MPNKKVQIIFGVFILIGALVFFNIKAKNGKTGAEIIQEIRPTIGTISNEISTTGTVLPKNRLEIKPPVNGRVDTILVKEGQKVAAGQVLAWMSSTERAALLDAARGQGDEALKRWEESYKAIPLISPIDSEVIVATTQPGQTVTTSDAVVVLSDQLIVRAQVDETDIGKVSVGQTAVISLDAYQDAKIRARVDHIYYESKTVNNVTIYEVDLIPENIPPFFRSGMNTTINFIESSKEDTMHVPIEAVVRERDAAYVLVKQANGKPPLKKPVVLGISDDKNVEIISGLSAGDIILSKTKKYSVPTANVGKSPFLPDRSRRR